MLDGVVWGGVCAEEAGGTEEDDGVVVTVLFAGGDTVAVGCTEEFDLAGTIVGAATCPSIATMGSPGMLKLIVHAMEFSVNGFIGIHVPLLYR